MKFKFLILLITLIAMPAHASVIVTTTMMSNGSAGSMQRSADQVMRDCLEEKSKDSSVDCTAETEEATTMALYHAPYKHSMPASITVREDTDLSEACNARDVSAKKCAKLRDWAVSNSAYSAVRTAERLLEGAGMDSCLDEGYTQQTCDDSVELYTSFQDLGNLISNTMWAIVGIILLGLVVSAFLASKTSDKTDKK